MRQPGRRLMIGGTVGFVIVSYGLFIFFPIVYGLWTSFYNWNPFQSKFEFVGLGNYTYVIQSPDFWRALANTVLFTVGGMILTVSFSLLLAAMMQGVKRA